MNALLILALLRGLVGAFVRRRPLIVDGWHLAALAHGDGVHDDTRHLQRAIDTGGVTMLDAGRFVVRDPMVLRNSANHLHILSAGLSPGEWRLRLGSTVKIGGG